MRDAQRILSSLQHTRLGNPRPQQRDRYAPINSRTLSKTPHACPALTLRGKYNIYKQLRALISKIIKDVWAAKLIQFPLPKKSKFPLANRSKYCKFHKDYDHDTNDCITLKDEIESLIRKGKLSKYKWYEEQKEHEEHDRRARSWSPWQRDNCKTNTDENQILSTVETISGDFTGGGLSNNVWKQHLQVVITMEPKK